MGNIIDSLFEKREKRIQMLGLDVAGKTSILYKLTKDQKVTLFHEYGQLVETNNYEEYTIYVWDVDYNCFSSVQRRHYFKDTKGLIFVVDSYNRKEEIDMASNMLQKILKLDEFRRLPLLVYANKQDLQNTVPTSELSKELKLNLIEDRPWMIQNSSALRGDGLLEGFNWLKEKMN